MFLACACATTFTTLHPQAPWYRGRGVFLDPPYLGMVRGQWRITHVPEWLSASSGHGASLGLSDTAVLGTWGSLEEVLDLARDGSGLVDVYK